MSDPTNEVITAEVGGNYTLPPAGNQLAMCTGLVVLGTSESTYEGHVKKEKKIMLIFELVSTNHVFKKENGPEPFIMHKEFTHSLNAKSNLRKFLNSWAGTKLTDEAAAGFNLAKLVGAGCFANVVHDKNKKGDDRADIISVSPIPAGIAVPAARTPIRIFNVNKQPFQSDIFALLAPWLQKKIQASDEYKAMNGTSIVTPAAGNTLPVNDNPFEQPQTGAVITDANLNKIF
jgi:hypothetical protein